MSSCADISSTFVSHTFTFTAFTPATLILVGGVGAILILTSVQGHNTSAFLELIH